MGSVSCLDSALGFSEQTTLINDSPTQHAIEASRIDNQVFQKTW